MAPKKASYRLWAFIAGVIGVLLMLNRPERLPTDTRELAIEVFVRFGGGVVLGLVAAAIFNFAGRRRPR